MGFPSSEQDTPLRVMHDFTRAPEDDDEHDELSMLPDVTITLDSGEKLYAARAILGLWSRVLNAMLTAMPELQSIPIRRLNIAQMTEVLNFMYPPPFGEVHDDDGDDDSAAAAAAAAAVAAAAAASAQASPSLSSNGYSTHGVDGCAELVHENNVSLLLSFAEEFDCPAMKWRCESFLIRHATHLGARMATGVRALALVTTHPSAEPVLPKLTIADVLDLSETFKCTERVQYVSMP